MMESRRAKREVLNQENQANLVDLSKAEGPQVACQLSLASPSPLSSISLNSQRPDIYFKPLY